MDDVERCRRTARTAVRDVEPPRLRATIERELASGSTTPGVLVLAAARARVDVDADGEVPEHVDERAAGVQLIYHGLRLIRELSTDPPWEAFVTARNRGTAGDVAADVDVAVSEEAEAALLEADVGTLAADVLVARGFYLLARTEAAGKAVETVRNFGADRTAGAPDHALEADVLELAVVAGTTAVGATPTRELLADAGDLARSVETPFPPVGDVRTDGEFDLELSRSAGVAGPADGQARTSAGDP